MPRPVLKASEIVKWCEDNGWHVSSKGDWTASSPKTGEQNLLYASMLHDCGKLVEQATMSWVREEWLEEVDE